MARPRLLDLFCGAGGAAYGYNFAGFDVLGVDINPQPRYPYPFVQADALDFLMWRNREFQAIHASPPCQRYSCSRTIHNSGDNHPDLVAPTRELLQAIGKPWIIENVPGAPLRCPLILCGSMFGLGVRRHRLFETSTPLLAPGPCKHPKDVHTGTHSSRNKTRGNGYSTGEFGLVCVAGNNFNLPAAAKAMGIDWMNRKEIAQAIPPAYTVWIGTQLINLL